MATICEGSATDALARSEERYFALVELCGKAIVIESAGRVVFANRAAGRLFAMESARELLGKHLRDLIPSYASAAPASDGQVPSAFNANVIARADGVALDVEIAAGACSFQGRECLQIVLRAPGPSAGKLETRARPDARNRTLFRDRVAGAISAKDGSAAMLAVMVLSIDGVESEDEAHGRQAAEAVMQKLAGRVIQGVRRDDAIARMSTNEYAILIEAQGKPELAGVMAQRELEAVSRGDPDEPGEARVTASIGIAVHTRRVHDADELIGNAYRALWAARKAGGNVYRFHSEEIEAEARRASGPRPETHTRLARLTVREREVLDMLVAGKASKMIAHLLGTSARTIDIHRARVMGKMRADSVASLVTMVLETGRTPGRPLRNTLEGDGEAE